MAGQNDANQSSNSKVSNLAKDKPTSLDITNYFDPALPWRLAIAVQLAEATRLYFARSCNGLGKIFRGVKEWALVA